ncbi:MAG: hypothetical protein LBU85_12305 [Treponema sp.]|jgi:hypothetical protein|nr:hypothetical protein [Treponema sp.]
MNCNYFKTFVTVFVFGFMLSINLYAQTDSRFNGNWIHIADDGIEEGLRIHKGYFKDLLDGKSARKGTCTEKNGKFTLEPTHIYGEIINDWLVDLLEVDLEDLGLESKWYTLDELILAFRLTVSNIVKMYVTEEYANELLDVFVSFFSPSTINLSKDANTIILVNEFEGETITVRYNKR